MRPFGSVPFLFESVNLRSLLAQFRSGRGGAGTFCRQVILQPSNLFCRRLRSLSCLAKLRFPLLHCSPQLLSFACLRFSTVFHLFNERVSNDRDLLFF